MVTGGGLGVAIDTERYQALLAGQGAQGAARTERAMAGLHPLGRVGQTAEVADAVAYLLSEQASWNAMKPRIQCVLAQ